MMTAFIRRASPLLLSLLVLAGPAVAQNPDTDIYLADLRITAKVIEIGAPRNLTDRVGYDNQPWFLRDGSGLLYNADMGGQTDIFRYDYASGTSTRLTDTPENEFSPSMSADGGEILVVRWAADMSDGHLWRYSPEGWPLGAHPADVPRVGYYGMANDSIVVAFVNDSVRSLVVANARTGELQRLGGGLGGSPPQRIPGQDAVSIVQPDSAGTMWIRRLDLTTHNITNIAPVVEGSLSYVWTADGVLLMPGGEAIHALNPAVDKEWREVARFEGIGTISRIALNAAEDRVALVVEQ
jgi:hypothetical protein